MVAATGAAAESPIRSTDVAHEGDSYVVKAQMFAPVPPALAWQVLIDFPNMAIWVLNLGDSRVVKLGDKEMTIEQHGTAKFGGLSLPYTSVREIVLTPHTKLRSKI